MNKNIQPINEEERNINWEDVENKIKILCNKFRNIDIKYRDDLAQELRIHAYYFSDDYYDLQRKAIDFWRSLSVKVFPEVPYLDLELIGGILPDTYEEIHFNYLVSELKKELAAPPVSESDAAIRSLASEILDIIIFDIQGTPTKTPVREGVKYKPYHNQRISCSYLWEVLGENVGSYNYKLIRQSLKFLGDLCIKLQEEGKIDIDEI